MLKHTRTFAMLAASGALLALPATGIAGGDHGKGKGKGQGSAKSCKAKKVGYVVRGTLVSVTADDPATADVNEAVVTMTVTGGNRHARNSGELADQDPVKPGVQVKGGTYTATAADDAFKLKLNGYEGTDTPSVGDKVQVVGKIALTKKRCAPDGTSLADRYGDPNIKKVTISDRDPDTP
ncbi:MAG: hypothetical protein ACRDKY_04295 [Solirubrobacteraceae bacterium]